MHFIREACYRRPLEPKGLAYSRGGTAIGMGLLFLAFVGYLINQIYNDHPLIQISSENIGLDIETPDVEICAQGSTMTVVKCSAMYYNWTVVDIPNCFQDYFRAGANNETSKCYVFESRNRYRMSTGLTYDSRNALRRLDFYWNVDSLQNLTASTISIPAIAVQLYDPHFTTWWPETIGDSPMELEMSTNIKLGATRATSYINHTSGIFYHLQKYRAIRKRDAATVFGLKPNFIEIVTLINNQHDWPIQSNPPPPPPAFDKNLYQGYFSVQLSQSTIDIKTEVRQHTILASVALAGGCYGVLTTIYILLFGMTRLTPWGLVHHIPVFFSRHRHADLNNSDDEESINSGTSSEIKAKKAKKKISSTILIPWFFRSRIRGAEKTYTPNDIKESIMTNMIVRSQLEEQKGNLNRVDTSELQLLNSSKSPSTPPPPTGNVYYRAPAPPLPPHYTTGSSSGSTVSEEIVSIPLNDNTATQQAASDERTVELSNRVEELEIILSEYFINTAYLDQLRNRQNGGLSAEEALKNLQKRQKKQQQQPRQQ
ncbi:unnamed protein product [Mucor hiemalis]